MAAFREVSFRSVSCQTRKSILASLAKAGPCLDFPSRGLGMQFDAKWKLGKNGMTYEPGGCC